MYNLLPSRRFNSEKFGCHISVQRRSDWSKLTRSTTAISIEISVGNYHCTGDNLKAIIEWTGVEWKQIQFSVGDTLHRFNIYAEQQAQEVGISLEEAADVASALGVRWVRENEQWISTLEALVDVIRWDDWRAHPDFQAHVSRYQRLFKLDERFRNCVLEDISNFNLRRGINSDKADNVNIQAKYIIEELAVYAIQASAGPLINIYPGSALKAVKYCQETSNSDAYLKRHFAYVKIRRSSKEIQDQEQMS